MSTPLLLAHIDAVYTCNRVLTLNTHFVAFPALAYFSVELRKFSGRLRDAVEDPYWRDFIRPLKRYRFDVSAAPWTAHSLREYTGKLYSAMQKHIETCHLVYPELEYEASSLLDTLKKVSEDAQAPILEGLQTITATLQLSEDHRGQIALLIKEPRLIPEAYKAISTITELRDCPVLVPQNIRTTNIFSKLVVVGPPYWYPEYVFSAPRANSIDVICYDWMDVHWEPGATFLAPARGTRRVRIKIEHNSTFSGASGEDLLPPSASIDQILGWARKELDDSPEDGAVEALLLVLEGENGVFVEATGETSILVIDLNEEISKRVKRVSHAQLEPEMYILLRTQGGGDYIIPLADQILGNQAHSLREMQQTWKSRLRSAIKQEGIEQVIEALKLHGSKIASYQNIRNWISDRTIMTEDPSEFEAITKLVGLHGSLHKYQTAMSEIRRAHMMAGQHIRKLLIQQINKSNLEELERTGVMEFSLPGQDAGSLTAYRIRSIASQTVEVAPSRIGRQFSLENV